MEKQITFFFLCLLSWFGIIAQTTVESRVSSTNDDAEETLSNGVVNLSSNDLDIRSSDLNAMRFQLNVPQGATVQDAWIEFKAKDTNSGSNTFTFSCQDSDDAVAFSSGSGSLSARSKTSATVNWNVPDWTLNQTYNSVDFAAAVQEVVNRTGWIANNHIVVFIEASGANKRAAKTFDFNGNDSESPKLVVTYQTSGGGGGGSTSAEVQAENFSTESGTSVSSGNAGFTGTGYLDYGGNGTFAEWVVNLSGTTADFVFRYAVGTTGQNRVCDLLINGSPAGSVDFNSTGGWSTWNTSSVTGVNINNGSNTIRLVANNSIGGPNLDKFDITTSGTGGGGDTQAPSVPTGLASSSVGETSFTLSWNISTDNVGVTGYRVYVDGSFSNTSSNETSTISGLTAGTTYSMTVSAIDAAGNESAQSSALSVTTDTPSGGGGGTTTRLEAESSTYSGGVLTNHPSASGGQFVDGNGGFNISWTYNASSAGSHILDFSVAAPSGTRTMGVFVNNNPVGTISTSAARYNWEDRSVSASLNSGTNTIELRDTEGANEPDVDYLEVITGSGGGGSGDTQAPSTPTGLFSSNVQQSSVFLSWNASTDNVGVTGYDIYRDGNFQESSTTTSETVSGLSSNTTYIFTVRAKDAAGNVSGSSNSVTVTTSGSGGGNAVYNRVRKLGTNFWYSTSDHRQDGTATTGEGVFIQQNPDFANLDNPWNPTFLENIKIYQVFRFMDWGATNYIPNGNPEPPITNWGDRTLKRDLKQYGAITSGRVIVNQADGRKTVGIAYEWWMDLCNRNQSDMWICVPHATIDPADFPNGDDYNNEFVHKLAILIKHGVDMKNVNIKNLVGGKNNLDDLVTKNRQWFIDRGGEATNDPLDTNLKVYLEYSNELWLRGQNAYANSKAGQVGLSSYYRYGAWADIRMWKAFRDVWGDDPRIVRLGGHNTPPNNGITNNHFNDVYNNSTHNPWGLQMDAWNANSYVNPGAQGPGNTICGSANNSTLDTRWTDEIEYKSNVQVGDLRANLAARGITSVVSYEGGQHFDCDAGDFARNSFSYNLMWEWADRYTAPDRFDIVCHYAHTGKWSPNGTGGIHSWGAKDTEFQSINDAHKYRGLKAWVDGLTVSSAARDAGEEGSIHIGIEQGLKSTEFKVYPNPTKDGSIKVVANSNVKNGQITVLTIEGKVLQKVQWNGELEEVQLNKTGLYILQLNDGNGLVKKFKVLNN